MATYFVSSGGSNTSPYDTWAKAATSLQTALTAASADGDVVVIQYDGVPSGDAEVSADTTYTVSADVSVVSASNDGGSSYTLTPMGTSNWVGNSTTARHLYLAGVGHTSYWYGFTFRITGNKTFYSNYDDNAHTVLDSCLLWLGASTRPMETSRADRVSHLKLRDCTIRPGGAGYGLTIGGSVEIEGGSIDNTDANLATLFEPGQSDFSVQDVTVTGMDLSGLATGAYLLANMSTVSYTVRFVRCKLPTSYVAMESQTNPNRATPECYLFDCAVGDTHLNFEYHNGLGSMVIDESIYYTSGAAGVSWKIVTNANATYEKPFESPWVDFYNEGTSAITPRFEILRDGSATAFKDDAVWGEFSIKETSGSVLTTVSRDRQAVSARLAGTTGTDQANGAGTGSWTGENATAWSGKVDSGSARTPAEIGHIRGRVVVGAASTTVYVDPEIRTA